MATAQIWNLYFVSWNSPWWGLEFWSIPLNMCEVLAGGTSSNSSSQSEPKGLLKPVQRVCFQNLILCFVTVTLLPFNCHCQSSLVVRKPLSTPVIAILGKGVAVGVDVGVDVRVGLAVAVAVAIRRAVLVGVAVGLDGGTGVDVAAGGAGIAVGGAGGTGVAVGGTGVAVGTGVDVGRRVAVGAGVDVGGRVAVAVGLGVRVGLVVAVGSGVGDE